MTDPNTENPCSDRFRRECFAIDSLEDEVRADERCKELLQLFCRHLVEREQLSPEEAGALANGADYFLREFLIGDRRRNIFEPGSGRVRQFAGNWYIVKNLDPSPNELAVILAGVRAFYAYCLELDKICEKLFEDIRKDCEEFAYYRQRIASFWALEGEDYPAWDQACRLEE